MDVESFKQLAKTFSAIPVYRQLLADTLTPVSLFLNIRKGSNYPFLFESVEGGDQLARYSFLGCNPYEVLQFDGQNFNYFVLCIIILVQKSLMLMKYFGIQAIEFCTKTIKMS